MSLSPNSTNSNRSDSGKKSRSSDSEGGRSRSSSYGTFYGGNSPSRPVRTAQEWVNTVVNVKDRHYLSFFELEDITTLSDVAQLTKQDLEKYGVAKLGARNRIYSAIQDLKERKDEKKENTDATPPILPYSLCCQVTGCPRKAKYTCTYRPLFPPEPGDDYQPWHNNQQEHDTPDDAPIPQVVHTSSVIGESYQSAASSSPPSSCQEDKQVKREVLIDMKSKENSEDTALSGKPGECGKRLCMVHAQKKLFTSNFYCEECTERRGWFISDLSDGVKEMKSQITCATENLNECAVC